jgi:hypothetical protein
MFNEFLFSDHLKHPGSMYSGHSAPVYTKRPEQPYGSKSLKLTNDLSGKYPGVQEKRRPQSEIGYMYRKSRSESGGTGTLRSKYCMIKGLVYFLAYGV